MKGGSLAFLTMAFLLAGCLEETSAPAYSVRTLKVILDSGVAPANRTLDQFYLVLVSGVEEGRRIAGDAEDQRTCSVHPPFAYDLGQRQVRYDPARSALVPNETAILIGVDVRTVHVGTAGPLWGCTSVERLESFAGRARLPISIRDDLGFNLTVEPQNGLLVVDAEYFLRMGNKLHVNYSRLESSGAASYYVTGDVELVNLGVFRQADLIADSTLARDSS